MPPVHDPARAERDAQYSPSRVAKNFQGDVERWRSATATARLTYARQGLFDRRYGVRPRQLLDVFPAAGPSPTPIHMFFHGGFWQELNKDYAAFAAPAFVAAGSAFVAVNYTLAPEATLAEIVGETRAAVDWVRASAASFGADPNRVVVSGHSAGAYLAATLSRQSASSDLTGIAGLVLISGVFELAPIADCYVNDQLRLTAAEAQRLDLLGWVPRREIPVRLFVGADETSEFRRQSRALRTAWSAHLRDMTLTELAGRDHFDILDDLSASNGPIHRAALALAGIDR